MTGWLTALADLVFPPKCPVCRQPVAEHGAWCQRCLIAPSALSLLDRAAHRLRWLDSCRFVCEYSGGVKRLLHDMKFRRQSRYAVQLTWLLNYCRVAEKLPAADLVIPAPLHADRLAERGFNQTEKIFRPWAAGHGLVWLAGALERGRPTQPQWGLSAAGRRQNIKDAFKLTRPMAVKQKIILLVDDIVTTGATLDECARILKQGGAAAVHGLALAGGDQWFPSPKPR